MTTNSGEKNNSEVSNIKDILYNKDFSKLYEIRKKEELTEEIYDLTMKFLGEDENSSQYKIKLAVFINDINRIVGEFKKIGLNNSELKTKLTKLSYNITEKKDFDLFSEIQEISSLLKNEISNKIEVINSGDAIDSVISDTSLLVNDLLVNNSQEAENYYRSRELLDITKNLKKLLYDFEENYINENTLIYTLNNISGLLYEMYHNSESLRYLKAVHKKINPIIGKQINELDYSKYLKEAIILLENSK